MLYDGQQRHFRCCPPFFSATALRVGCVQNRNSFFAIIKYINHGQTKATENKVFYKRNSILLVSGNGRNVRVPQYAKSLPCRGKAFCVVLGGFEPPQTEPKPVVLPLHHRTLPFAKVRKRCPAHAAAHLSTFPAAKVTLFCATAKFCRAFLPPPQTKGQDTQRLCAVACPALSCCVSRRVTSR